MPIGSLTLSGGAARSLQTNVPEWCRKAWDGYFLCAEYLDKSARVEYLKGRFSGSIGADNSVRFD